MWRDRRKAHAKEKEKETAQETTRPAAEATVPSTSACGVAEVVNRVPDARFNLSMGASLGLFRGVAGLTPVLQIKDGRAGVDVKHCFPRSTIQLSTQPPDRSKVQTLAPSSRCRWFAQLHHGNALTIVYVSPPPAPCVPYLQRRTGEPMVHTAEGDSTPQ
jgi:hypothetical protein